VPKSILEKERIQAFDASVEFIKSVHKKYGFDIKAYEMPQWQKDRIDPRGTNAMYDSFI
jgi:hypothetical protein